MLLLLLLFGGCGMDEQLLELDIEGSVVPRVCVPSSSESVVPPISSSSSSSSSSLSSVSVRTHPFALLAQSPPRAVSVSRALAPRSPPPSSPPRRRHPPPAHGVFFFLFCFSFFFLKKLRHFVFASSSSLFQFPSSFSHPFASFSSLYFLLSFFSFCS